MSKRYIGLDCETYDNLLKEAGYSWKYGQGYILCTALYYEDTDRVDVVAGLKNENCPYDLADRQCANKEIIDLLTDSNVCIIGANLQYDIGWHLSEYGMTTFDVKCSFVDVLQAESILDEFSIHDLDKVSYKYLKHGKTKTAIEEWVRKTYPKFKKDFRQKLKDAPWELLCEYVKGDAKFPVQIWKKQLTLLKEQDLCKRAKLEFDCILPILQITMNGYPIDNEQREKNCELLKHYIELLKTEFQQKYNMPKFSVTKARDVASFFDKHNIPYRYKITIKGYGDSLFASGDYKAIDSAYAKAKKLVSSFRYVKSVPVAYVPKELADRTISLLEDEGFIVISSPNIDKKVFAGLRETYPEVALIADWKLATGMVSKFLGEKYNRYLIQDKDGGYRIKGQFKITDTVSFRLSSNSPNQQQVPSKGGFKIHENGKEIDVSFPALTRALFHAEKGKVLCKIDYGQIEYRLICNIACGESGAEVRRQYAENPKLDFHQYTVDLTGLSRKYAKSMSFGISFGMGIASMAENFGWTREKAEEIAEQYNEHLPFVQPTLALVGDLAVEKGYIKTVCGSRARLPNPNKKYTMLNRYTQGSGAEILKTAIVQAYKEGLWERLDVKNQVHDELNMSISPDEQGITDCYRMAEIMRTAVPSLRVPLEAEPEFGDNWANTHLVSEWVEMRDKGDDTWTKASPELKQAITTAERLLKENKISA